MNKIYIFEYEKSGSHIHEELHHSEVAETFDAAVDAALKSLQSADTRRLTIRLVRIEPALDFSFGPP